jgi:flagellar L-ring protein FlgH
MKRLVVGMLVTLTLAVALPPAGLRAQEAPTATAAQPRQSWTSDRRAFRPGDVLTVLIDEHTVATQQSGTSAERVRTQSAEAGASAGSALPSGAVAARSASRGDSRERGDARRITTFAGEVAVRVMEVTDNGMLRIEGTKRIAVDRGTQEMHVSGWIRPQDVSGRNVIESWRVAELELRHDSRGSLATPRRSIFGRIVDLIWP